MAMQVFRPRSCPHSSTDTVTSGIAGLDARATDRTPQRLLAHDLISALAALDDSSLLHIDSDLTSLRRPSACGADTSHLQISCNRKLIWISENRSYRLTEVACCERAHVQRHLPAEATRNIVSELTLCAVF